MEEKQDDDDSKPQRMSMDRSTTFRRLGEYFQSNKISINITADDHAIEDVIGGVVLVLLGFSCT